MNAVSKLLSISSPSLCGLGPQGLERYSQVGPERVKELLALLNRRNGFMALEESLHLFPAGVSQTSFSLDEWNENGLWRSSYAQYADYCLFFAEDIFGGQFCIKDNLVHTFDPETGKTEEFAKSIDRWAETILSDFEVVTGYPLAHEWQSKHGRLMNRYRLIPSTPFVLGGEYVVDNLFAIQADKGMRVRGDIAMQIRNSPPGTRVEFKFGP